MTQSKPQGPPNKHHFVPEFLLKRWKGPDGSICRYFRNAVGEIDCKPASPGGMGYGQGLYSTEGLRPEHKQQVETLFMQPLDTEADRVHQRLLDGEVGALSDEQRCRWAGLIMSLWFRTPGEVAGIRAAVEALYDSGIGRSLPGSDELIELPDTVRNELAMQVMMRAIDDGDRGRELINMHWDVIEIDRSREFFISDSPLSQPSSFARLGAPASYIAMPISPTKLFIAANSPTLSGAMRKLPQRELVARQNRAAVGQAEHFVGATSRAADKFIRATFGTTEPVSLTRNIAAKYRAMGGGKEG